MKRYRISTFNLDATQNVFTDCFPPEVAMNLMKKDMEASIKYRYGEIY